MAFDMILELKGIDGESKQKGFEGKIDVLAWSWGESNSGSAHVGGGAGAGKANAQDLSITKWVDKATPNLFIQCANGKHIPSGKLTVRKAGEKPMDYLTVELTDILISSYHTGGSGGEDRLTENVTFNFAKIKLEYAEQKQDGSKGTSTPKTWNIQTGEFE